MRITIEELREIADMTVRLCEIDIDGQMAHSTDKAPEVFGGLLRAYIGETAQEWVDGWAEASGPPVDHAPDCWKAATGKNAPG
jgi:hypothetical protein